MNKLKYLILFLLLLLILGGNHFLVQAEETIPPNNKFGIHLAVATEEDLQEAAQLLNSGGGDWGYVTLVIEEKDRQREKWQRVFDQMRALHLIPIVRLATSMEGGSWRRPKVEDAQNWADFLDSLNWVIKNRYLVLFNEPNRADEWGGGVDPEDYGKVAFEFAKALKEKNPDFFIMMAGFDAAAPGKPPNYEDEEVFLRKMIAGLAKEKKEIFAYLDGWASHSYPNHGFVGSPYGVGRNSVRTYLWELAVLGSQGVEKNLPVFITETGWPHAEGKSYKTEFYSQNEVADNFRIMFGRLLDDPKVLAITPFILNYQGEPFDHFSWRKLGNSLDYYPQYELTRNLGKVKGEPKQEQKLKVLTTLPYKLIAGSTYQLAVNIRNEGQAIWSRKDGYQLRLAVSEGQEFDYFFSDFLKLPPFTEETLWLYLKTGDKLGKFNLSLVVTKDGQAVSNERPWFLEIIPALDIDFQVSLFPKRETRGDNFKLLIYNDKEEVIFEQGGIKVEGGIGQVKAVRNLAIGKKYRLVILRPYYLPRQGFLTVQEEGNKIIFERMLPLDFNQDGELSFGDPWALIKKPSLFQLFWLN